MRGFTARFARAAEHAESGKSGILTANHAKRAEKRIRESLAFLCVLRGSREAGGDIAVWGE
jgi:hypothetical protein